MVPSSVFRDVKHIFNEGSNAWGTPVVATSPRA